MNLPNDVARCFPYPECPDQSRCSRAQQTLPFVAMNAMPYRVEGEECQWFVQKVEVEA